MKNQKYSIRTITETLSDHELLALKGGGGVWWIFDWLGISSKGLHFKFI